MKSRIRVFYGIPAEKIHRYLRKMAAEGRSPCLAQFLRTGVFFLYPTLSYSFMIFISCISFPFPAPYNEDVRAYKPPESKIPDGPASCPEEKKKEKS